METAYLLMTELLPQGNIYTLIRKLYIFRAENVKLPHLNNVQRSLKTTLISSKQ